MSYDLYLVDPSTKKVLEAEDPLFLRGGTYAIGGDTRAHLNVTYNYYPHLVKAFENPKGIRSLYGTSGEDSIPLLVAARSRLGDDVHEDYWEATEGNTKAAITKMLILALLFPAGIWDGD